MKKQTPIILIMLLLLSFLSTSRAYAYNIAFPIPLYNGWNSFVWQNNLPTNTSVNSTNPNCQINTRENYYWKPLLNSYTNTTFQVNQKYLSKCTKPLNRKSIDPRIGIVHVIGTYPDRSPQKDFLTYGMQDAYNLGFNTFEIYLSHETCLPSRPYYQTMDICLGCTAEAPCNKELKDIASGPQYQKVFSMPFDTLIMTTDAFKDGSLNIWALYELKPLDVTKTNNMKREFYNLVTYLFQTYGSSEKTIIIQTPNEMDWALLAHATPNTYPEGNPPQIAIDNMVIYLNAIQDAIDQAKRENLNKELKIYHSCEIARAPEAEVLGKIRAVNSVVPKTHCDLYGYSSYGAYIMLPPNAPPNYNVFDGTEHLKESIEYIRQFAPDSPDFGNNNVFISELGIFEDQVAGTYSESQVATAVNKLLNDALSLNVPYFMYWQLYNGSFIRKADGSLGKVYTDVFLKRFSWSAQ